jgi:Sigma-70, region 4
MQLAIAPRIDMSQLVIDFDTAVARLTAERAARERAKRIAEVMAYAPSPTDRPRFRVVWPPQTGYGGLSTVKPTSDPFAAELFALDANTALPDGRPQTREECHQTVRPCPFVSCRFNLYLDVREDGVLRLNFPDKEPDEVTASCSLDLANDGPRTLEQVAALMGMSKERARQIESAALAKLKAALPRPEDRDIDGGDWV